MNARGCGHALGHHLGDAPGGVDRAEPDLRADASHRAFRRRGIQRHPSAEKEAGIIPAQHEVRVGHCRLRAATAVAGRARIGTRAFRPDAQQPNLVDHGDRAAAGADLDHVDHRGLDRQA